MAVTLCKVCREAYETTHECTLIAERIAERDQLMKRAVVALDLPTARNHSHELERLRKLDRRMRGVK